MASETVRRILVVDDDASRHADMAAWIAKMGYEAHVHATPPADPGDPALVALVVIHAGYGRSRPGFPRPDRRAEAIHWFVDDPSFLFHDDLVALSALGKALPDRVPVVAMTGGSGKDIPVQELGRLAGARLLVSWNVLELFATTSIEEILAGPACARPGQADPACLASELRHDLLNRLWNLALAAAEATPDEAEIADIVTGDPDQSQLGVLVASASGIDPATRSALTGAIDRAVRGGGLPDGLARLARAAISELEGR